MGPSGPASFRGSSPIGGEQALGAASGESASPGFRAPTALASGGCVPPGLASWRSPLRVDCAALLGAGARARTRCAPAALRSNSWRESVDEARCARRPHPCGARRHSTPAPAGRSHRSLATAWRGSIEKSRFALLAVARAQAPSSRRLRQISLQIVKRVLASSGHRGRDDARGRRRHRPPGLTRISCRCASAPSSDGRQRTPAVAAVGQRAAAPIPARFNPHDK